MERLALTQGIFWPGARAIESCEYTASHGETAGIGVLEVREAPVGMSPIGNLILEDGIGALTVRGCKVVDVKYSRDSNGDRWVVRFLDRRWRWEESGSISGHYNELDSNGKLVPWKIRSPEELAILCLQALGETNYEIDMPEGIPRALYEDEPNYFTVGINTLPTGTNPEITWQDMRPSAALSELCAMFGRRLVYDPVQDRVLIARPGIGAALPTKAQYTRGANLSGAPTPDAIGVVGSPAVFQVRLQLVPVAKEWHGQYVPVDQVSYRPAPTVSKNIYQVAITNDPVQPDPTARLNPPALSVVVNGREYATAGFDSPRTAASTIATLIATDTSSDVTVSLSGTILTLTGKKTNSAQEITATGFRVKAVVSPQVLPSTLTDWATCFPPGYATVRPTERLTYAQARQLAAESVFRCYRVADYGLDTGVLYLGANGPEPVRTPIFVPRYGYLRRRQQLLLQQSAVEQVTPQPIDLRLINAQSRETPGVVWDTYNGYSRNREAAVYGEICKRCSNHWWINNAVNTPKGERISVPFSIDPINQVITFSQPVYLAGTGPTSAMLFPELVLEIGVLVADSETNEVVRYRRWYPIAEGTVADNERPVLSENPNVREKARDMMSAVPPRWTEWHAHEDIWHEIVGQYQYDPANEVHQLVAAPIVDDEESKRRADYYLEGHIVEHIARGGESATYAGIRLISLDGAVQQVTWSVGRGGARTTASRDMEHAPFLPPYPARRRKENLDANAQFAEFTRKSPHFSATEAAFKTKNG